MSHQTGRLPSVFSIVKDFMVESGFTEGQIGISESRGSLTYAGWELGGIDANGRFYIIAFKTNREVYLNPADPSFFTKLREALMFPKREEEWGSFWHGPSRYVDIPPNFL